MKKVTLAAALLLASLLTTTPMFGKKLTWTGRGRGVRLTREGFFTVARNVLENNSQVTFADEKSQVLVFKANGVECRVWVAEDMSWSAAMSNLPSVSLYIDPDSGFVGKASAIGKQACDSAASLYFPAIRKELARVFTNLKVFVLVFELEQGGPETVKRDVKHWLSSEGLWTPADELGEADAVLTISSQNVVWDSGRRDFMIQILPTSPNSAVGSVQTSGGLQSDTKLTMILFSNDKHGTLVPLLVGTSYASGVRDILNQMKRAIGELQKQANK